MALKTDYKDDILDLTQNDKRCFEEIQNQDGSTSFRDVTVYEQEGDNFGASDINATNLAVNQLDDNLTASDNLKFQFTKSGNDYGYKDSNGNFHPFNRVQASKTVTAGTSAKTVSPDSGYHGIASVTVNPTPSQSKSVTATTSAQTVSPDNGKLLSSVTVNPQVHSGTMSSVTSNGTVDLGANHAIRYVPVNVPIDVMIPTLNKGVVSGGGNTREGIYLSVVQGCYYMLAVAGAETGTDARVTSFSGCQIISNSGAQSGFRGCHCCLYIVLATSDTITFPAWSDLDADGRAVIAMKIS